MVVADCRLRHLHLAFILLLCLTGFAQDLDQTGDSCRTPNNEAGQCVSFRSCEAYQWMLTTNPVPANTTEYLRKAFCRFEDKRPFVCCPSSVPDQTGAPEDDSNTMIANASAHPNWKYLKTDICGTFQSDQIVSGVEAKFGEYPWLALIQYQTSAGLRFMCGGSLIGTRYVLTAAHCVPALPNYQLASIRLGEHNIETNPDCKAEYEGSYCADPIQEFNISEIIVHPQYKLRIPHHDIALLRLDRDAPISEYISPICIPPNYATEKIDATRFFKEAGWEIAGPQAQSGVKLQGQIQVVGNTQCERAYQRITNITANQICAIATERGCKSDSGGPLMAFVGRLSPEMIGNRWVAAGVLSSGPRSCDISLPRVYTRVRPYVNWILDNLKP